MNEKDSECTRFGRKKLEEIFFITQLQDFDKNRKLYMGGNCLVDAILMTAYIHQYVDTAIRLKCYEELHEVGSPLIDGITVKLFGEQIIYFLFSRPKHCNMPTSFAQRLRSSRLPQRSDT